jgi:hypothetical protein
MITGSKLGRCLYDKLSQYHANLPIPVQLTVNEIVPDTEQFWRKVGARIVGIGRSRNKQWRPLDPKRKPFLDYIVRRVRSKAKGMQYTKMNNLYFTKDGTTYVGIVVSEMLQSIIEDRHETAENRSEALIMQKSDALQYRAQMYVQLDL